MQTLTRPRLHSLTVGTLVVLTACFAVAMDLALQLPLKLPGHRALPGALALIFVAQQARPLAILAFAGVVSLLLALLPGGAAPLMIPWLGLAPLLMLLRYRRVQQALWLLVLLGMLFGLLRVGMLWGGLHKTPHWMRLSGHLFFGGVGGSLAYLLGGLLQQPTAPATEP